MPHLSKSDSESFKVKHTGKLMMTMMKTERKEHSPSKQGKVSRSKQGKYCFQKLTYIPIKVLLLLLLIMVVVLNLYFI